MLPKWLQNGSKSLQVGAKIGSQTTCLHVNAPPPSVPAQKPLRKPIWDPFWDPFGLDLGSSWARFSMDFGQILFVYRKLDTNLN